MTPRQAPPGLQASAARGTDAAVAAGHTASVFVIDGSELKLISGIDDRSRSA
jgi:hypothetical protein